VLVSARLVEPPERPWPYVDEPVAGPGDAGSGIAEPGASVEVALRPYHGWANRGPSTMRVWLPAEGG
jgi:hypothetical protein